VKQRADWWQCRHPAPPSCAEKWGDVRSGVRAVAAARLSGTRFAMMVRNISATDLRKIHLDPQRESTPDLSLQAHFSLDKADAGEGGSVVYTPPAFGVAGTAATLAAMSTARERATHDRRIDRTRWHPTRQTLRCPTRRTCQRPARRTCRCPARRTPCRPARRVLRRPAHATCQHPACATNRRVARFGIGPCESIWG